MKCPHCEHTFSAASAWSIEEGGELIDGVLCPECGEFIASEDLEEQADEADA